MFLRPYKVTFIYFYHIDFSKIFTRYTVIEQMWTLLHGNKQCNCPQQVFELLPLYKGSWRNLFFNLLFIERTYNIYIVFIHVKNFTK